MLCQIAPGHANPRVKQTLPFVSGMEKFEFYPLRRSKEVAPLMVALCGPDMRSRVWSSTPVHLGCGRPRASPLVWDAYEAPLA